MPPPQTRPSQKQPAFRQQSLDERVDDYKRDLDTIEVLFEQIRREYDLYFAGARKRPPFELRAQIDKMLRKWRASSIQKLELTFRLNSLNSKWNSMVDIWEKIVKRREVDPRALSPYGPSHDKLLGEAVSKREQAEAKAALGAGAGAAKPAAAARAPVDPETRLRKLFDQYVDAKKDMGETVESMSYQRFKTQLDKQVDQIRQKTNCKDVEFGVIRKDGKVSLTAKPVKE